MKIFKKLQSTFMTMSYRKRMILNGIFSTILSFVIFAASWEGNGPFLVKLIPTIIFSIFALATLASTVYFIIKKDIKKSDNKDNNGNKLLEAIKPYYSNKTYTLIYRMSLVLSLLLAVAAIWAASITAFVALVLLLLIQAVIISPLVAIKRYM